MAQLTGQTSDTCIGKVETVVHQVICLPTHFRQVWSGAQLVGPLKSPTVCCCLVALS